MINLEDFATKQITSIIPKFDSVSLRATVSDSSYAIEFFVVIDGKKKQCYELADEGVLKESDLDDVLKRIAEYIRSSSDYRRDCVNKISF